MLLCNHSLESYGFCRFGIHERKLGVFVLSSLDDGAAVCISHSQWLRLHKLPLFLQCYNDNQEHADNY